MKSILATIVFTASYFILPNYFFAQSVHETELNYYNSLGNATADHYESLPHLQSVNTPKSPCNVNKIVYGWHPYWVGSAYQNYQWDLLTHLSFFSYEVDYATGNAVSTHGWSTSAAVNAALATGTTKVTLCVTLFSNHATFLSNSSAKQTLISNLISLVSTRGAHGVNIDFEGLPSSQSTTFANFMVDLANQMHAAIPGSEISTVLYSVDWNSVFNFQIMEPEVDHYIIMGYDYYYSGSTTAGPNDPLYQFGNSYNYTLSRSITDYLEKGCPANKLILGLPSYGREWSTSSLTVPSGTTATGVSRTYSYVRNNSTGFYSAANHSYENASQSDMYLFMNGSTPKQCFITEEEAFSKRLQHVLVAGIGGIGMWALGYDDGYTELWDAIRSKMTDCYADSCSGTIHDFGGPLKNYYNNEDYTWTISPQNATSLDINFSVFDVELNYDYLYVYDGNSTASPQIPGSPFTGTNSPGTFTTTTGAITFRFTSDLSTVKPGFLATYTCNQDDIAPTTSLAVNGNWQTQDFSVQYTDTDNAAIDQRFSLVTDHDGTQRMANRSLGYLFEDFSNSISNQWTTGLGTWGIAGGWLNQTSETEGNSACNSSLTQVSTSEYVYHWKGKINGAGTNRRAGLHFFCSDASLPNRGDSYLVYWRADTDKCQIYRSTSDNLVLQTNDDIVVDPNVEYDFKITYEPSNGTIKAFLNNQLVSSWIDPSPITTGNSISFRSGNCSYLVDDVKVYRSRMANQTVTIDSPSDMVRYQNINSSTPNCQIFSLVKDNAENFSTVIAESFNIDWTSPSTSIVNDGVAADIAVFATPNEISANWTNSLDPNSDVVEYFLAVGTSLGGSDVFPFSSQGIAISATITGLSLSYGQTYYISVKSLNGAGLESLISSSDGQLLQIPTSSPIANFNVTESIVCEGDSILLLNTSTDGTSFLWSASSGIINDPTSTQAYFIPSASGSVQITLTATNAAGSDQMTQNLNFTILAGPIASALPDNSNLTLPNAIVLFSNTSQNSDTYFWSFGDGESTNDQHPWHQYSEAGTYTVMLVASRDGCLSDTTYFLINVGYADLNEIGSSTFSVYPNPFQNEISLRGIHLDEMHLYDLHGKLITHVKLNGTQKDEVLIIHKIEKGVYLLKIKDNGVWYFERLIKM